LCHPYIAIFESATEVDEKTEADDVEVAAKLAGPQPMFETRRTRSRNKHLKETMSCASATEADDKTEADDVEVAVKLAGT